MTEAERQYDLWYHVGQKIILIIFIKINLGLTLINTTIVVV